MMSAPGVRGVAKEHMIYILRDKMNCTVRFGDCNFRVPCCLVPCCQGKQGEFTNKQLTKRTLQFILSLSMQVIG